MLVPKRLKEISCHDSRALSSLLSQIQFMSIDLIVYDNNVSLSGIDLREPPKPLQPEFRLQEANQIRGRYSSAQVYAHANVHSLFLYSYSTIPDWTLI